MPSRLWQLRHRRRLSLQNNQDHERFDVGPMNNVCRHCGALLWKQENKALCCANGQVMLPPIPEAPPLLEELLTGNSSRAKTFRQRIRSYNASLAFASIGVNEDILPPGVYCFRIHGEIHHSVGPLLPEPGPQTNPRFAQVYYYDTVNETRNRAHWHDNLDIDVLTELQDHLHEVNPYVQV